MKSHFSRFLVFSVILLASWGCSKKATNPTFTWSVKQLSGVWDGEIIYTKAGSCNVGGVTCDTASCVMNWTVNESGSIMIVEDNYRTWEGAVNKGNLLVSLNKTFRWIKGINMNTGSCPDSIIVGTASYTGNIQKYGDTLYTLDVSGSENWCPASNCLFAVRYKIRLNNTGHALKPVHRQRFVF